jgi:preprotein translocase subunit SecY
MLKTISGIFKDKEVRTKLLYTILALIVFRVLAAIPTPGLDKEALSQLFENSSFGQILSMVTGNVLEQASIIAIGLGPYINASVIIQLLATVVPSLEALQEQGTAGQMKLSQYTRFLTVPLAVIQSFVIYTILRQGVGSLSIQQLTPMELVVMIATLTAGALILMWIGEVITETSLTNGVSLIIGAGVLSALPGAINQDLKVLDVTEQLFLLAGFLVVMMIIILVNEAQRKVEVQYASRVRGTKSVGGMSSHLPLKLNQSGVMPVIFAISFLSFPALVAQIFTGSQFPLVVRNLATWLTTFSTGSPFLYNMVLFSLILGFSFFYMFVVFNPEKISENLKKQGGFVPGIRPGVQTEEYLRKIMWRTGFIGGIFLASIAVLPTLATSFIDVATIGVTGTGLLILVSVVLDIKRKTESLLVTKSYSDYS